jgi:Fe-S cluster assembly ATP-binding protein
MASPERSILLITHYQRMLDYVTPQFVHIMQEGQIVMSGGPEIVAELETHGYDWVGKELASSAR